MAKVTFADLGLSSWLLGALGGVNIRSPTPIQANCIRPILQGRDVVASAQTGTGKTAAFALPMLQKLSEDPYGVFGVVLTPTRELAYQIADQFKVYGKSIHARVSVVVGGVDMMVQMRELNTRPHIIVATPGRLADALRSCSDAVVVKKARFLVLDEADRLLEPTFADEMAVVLQALPKRRQTLLFSATMSRTLDDMGSLSMNDPFIFHATANDDTVAQLDQRYLFVPQRVKEVYLVHLLQNQLADKSLIIFVGRCRSCEILTVMLRELDIKVCALHSSMNQAERMASLAIFRSGVIKVLVTTDVGSRGLDIPLVEVVVNFDVPSATRDYVHRVGRTARAGRGGMAFSIVSERDIELLQAIEGRIGKQLSEFQTVESDVLKLLNKVSAAHKAAVMHILESKFDERRELQQRKRKAAAAEEEAEAAEGETDGVVGAGDDDDEAVVDDATTASDEEPTTASRRSRRQEPATAARKQRTAR